MDYHHGMRAVDPATGAGAAAAASDFLVRLRGATRSLHTAAERSGIFHALLGGEASRYGYVLLLRNLEPVYRRLEAAIDQCPVLAPLRLRAVYRADAAAADLEALAGAHWADTVPVLAAGRDYADRVAGLAAESPARLIGHAYTRYLGDLNGGQILRRTLVRELGLSSGQLAFYAFDEDAAALAALYRRAMAAAAAASGAGEAVLAEAVTAFRHNIAVSEAVAAAAGEAVQSPPCGGAE